MRWAKVLGLCAVSAYLASLGHASWTEWRKQAAVERHEIQVKIDACNARLNLVVARLEQAADAAEAKACSTGAYRVPHWICRASDLCVWGQGKFGCSNNADNPAKDMVNRIEPACNRQLIRSFSCGTEAGLNGLLGRCGLLEDIR